MKLTEQIAALVNRLDEARVRRGARLAAVTLAIPDPSLEEIVVGILGNALAQYGLSRVEIVVAPRPGPIRVVATEWVR